MNVIINNTQQIEELSITDHKTGLEWTVDLLGNAGIHKDADTDAVTMDREEFEWWQNYIEGHEATERQIAELAEQAGVEYHEIHDKVFDYMGQQDMENERGRAIQMLEELKKEYLGDTLEAPAICAACGNLVETGTVFKTTLVCRACLPAVRDDIARRRNDGERVDVRQIARALFRHVADPKEYILKDIPGKLWEAAQLAAKDQQCASGGDLRELILYGLWNNPDIQKHLKA